MEIIYNIIKQIVNLWLKKYYIFYAAYTMTLYRKWVRIIKSRPVFILFVILLILACCTTSAQAEYDISYRNSCIRISTPVGNTQNGAAEVTGKAAISEVWFCVRGPNDELTKYKADVVNGIFKAKLYLRFGPGEYTVWAGDNSYRFDGSIRFEIHNYGSSDNRYIAPSMYADSEHQQIIEQAQELELTGLSDREKIEMIHNWMALNIAYDWNCVNRPWLPASQIINEKKGVCKDYAVLFAALARASGLPCRIVIGEVNISDRIIGMHAWNEVLMEGEWVPVDVCLDAGYINTQCQFVFEYSSEYLLPAPVHFALTHQATSISPY